jgi:hypothetical protein
VPFHKFNTYQIAELSDTTCRALLSRAKWRGVNCEMIMWGQLKNCQEFVGLVGDKALRAMNCIAITLLGSIMRQWGGKMHSRFTKP